MIESYNNFFLLSAKQHSVQKNTQHEVKKMTKSAVVLYAASMCLFSNETPCGAATKYIDKITLPQKL